MHGADEYFTPINIIRRLQAQIQERADASHQQYLYNYLKRAIPVRGVRIQELRAAMSTWLREWNVEQQTVPVETERSVAFLLLREPMFEDKLAALEFLAETLIPAGKVTEDDLGQFETLFQQGSLHSYKVCDNFAAKVLKMLILKRREVVVERLRTWFRSASVWQARAALGALCGLAADGVYEEAILEGCGILIQRSEDEAKSIVGTALRAVGKHRPAVVATFLSNDDVLKHFDASALQKAATNLDGELYGRLKNRRKMLVQQAGLEGGVEGDPGAGPSAATEEGVEEAEEQVEQEEQIEEEALGMDIDDPFGGVGLEGEFEFEGELVQGMAMAAQPSQGVQQESQTQEEPTEGTEEGMEEEGGTSGAQPSSSGHGS